MKRNHLITILCLVLVSTMTACVRPAPGTYTSDPSKRENKISSKNIRIEVYVLENNSIPTPQVQVRAQTKESSDRERTNSKGRTRLSVMRSESEPIKFTFKKDGFTSIETVHHLPSNVSDVGLVFSYDSPGRVKFVNYTVKGLYR